MKWVSSLGIILLLFCFLSGCSTTLETRESDTASENSETAPSTTSPASWDESLFPGDDDQYKDQDGLFITSYPIGAKVYIDSQYRGTTPVFVRSLEIGDYHLKLLLPGYYPHTARIYYAGEYRAYKTVLIPITGTLELKILPGDAIVLINDTPVQTKTTELKPGTYTCKVRKFGYNEYKEVITIREKETTIVQASLTRADFAIAHITLSRKRLNPRNPGGLGKTDISFTVTGPGTGNLAILNDVGDEVFSRGISSFQTWRQIITWNGMTGDGVLCRDGEYTIRITARGKNGKTEQTLTHKITIDSSLDISFRSMWHGISGLAYVPSGEILPPRSFQIASSINVHTDKSGDESVMEAPSLIALRCGIGFSSEIGILTGLIFTGTGSLPFTGSVSIKKRILSVPGPLSVDYGVSGKLTYHTNSGKDPFTNFTGFSVGSPFQAGIGPFSVLLSPEITISPYGITNTDTYDDEFTTWGYARFGILFDTGTIVAGASGALCTTSFLEPDTFGIQYPLHGAVEISSMIPSTNTFISLALSVEYESMEDTTFTGGFNLGFIY